MDVKPSKLLNPSGPDTISDDGGSFAGAKPRNRVHIKVGGVYVTSDRASAAQRQQAVAASADMIHRLGHKIAKPGVQLKIAHDIPLFFVDPDRAGRFLRELNGKTEGGVLENGAFKVLD